MYRVTKELRFCYGHRLIDYSGPCVHPHGHNARVVVELTREALDRADMVYDFADLKQVLQSWIDSHLDHRMLLRHDDPLVAIFKELGEPVYVMERNPTAEAIAEEIFRYAQDQGLPVTAVQLWETETASATYRLEAEGKENRYAVTKRHSGALRAVDGGIAPKKNGRTS